MRKFFVLLALGALAAGLLATSGSAATGSKGGSAATKSACAAQLPARVGHFGGIVSAMPAAGGSCTSDAANGNPPLLYWGGPVMGTDSTGPITVTPIFWEPSGYYQDGQYMYIITQYLNDVAAASGSNSNVYSTATEYYGTNGSINYDMVAGDPIYAHNPLPHGGCTVGHKDKTGIYADGSGYTACVDDAQVNAEIQSVIDAKGLPQNDYQHIYVLFLPKHVASCFYGVSTANKHNVCTIDHYPSAGYCAYHSMMGNNWPDYGTVYANIPYPIYNSAVGYTCGTNSLNEPFGGAIESPNGNPDADTVLSGTSHEIMESITDPNVYNGWYDIFGYENGDECAYVWGEPDGTAGALYTQTINDHHYMTQEEFSNTDFFNTSGAGGCVQSESEVTPAP